MASECGIREQNRLPRIEPSKPWPRPETVGGQKEKIMASEEVEDCDTCREARSLTVAERLEVAKWFYLRYETMDHAAAILKSDGWRHLAPAWIEEWRAVWEAMKRPTPWTIEPAVPEITTIGFASSQGVES